MAAPLFEAGKPWMGSQVTPTQPIAQEGWGGIWRGDHPAHGKVILVAYGTESGRQLFAEAQPGLERWQTLSKTFAAAGLLPIHAIVADAPAPYLIVADSHGETLREAVGKLNLSTQASMAQQIAKTVFEAETHDLGYLGITPDTIIQNPTAQNAPGWRLIPVAPGAKRQATQLGGGRYVPPELANHPAPGELHADIFSLSWIWAEAAAHDWNLGHTTAAVKAAIPHKGLLTVLEHSFAPRVGKYPDAKLTHIAAERYSRQGAPEDEQAFAEAQAAAQRKPWQQFLHENKKPLTAGGIFLVSVILLVCAIVLVPKLFVAGGSDETPYGVVNLYFEQLADRNPTGAKAFASPAGDMHTDQLWAAIQQMERDSLTSRFDRAVPNVSGSGTDIRQANVDLLGENGDNFMEVEARLVRGPDGRWKLDQILYQPLRTKEGNQ